MHWEQLTKRRWRRSWSCLEEIHHTESTCKFAIGTLSANMFYAQLWPLSHFHSTLLYFLTFLSCLRPRSATLNSESDLLSQHYSSTCLEFSSKQTYRSHDNNLRPTESELVKLRRENQVYTQGLVFFLLKT